MIFTFWAYGVRAKFHKCIYFARDFEKHSVLNDVKSLDYPLSIWY